MRELARKIMHTPVEINIAMSMPAAGISQKAVVLYENQKRPMLKKILSDNKFDSVLIFASTKSVVKELEKDLRQILPAKSIHSDLTQQERESVLLSFRNKSTRVLVATDILSRGIDIEDIGLVINYDVPSDAEDYIHRIGRTARAEASGEAVTFISEKDQRKFAMIEKLMDRVVEKIPVPPEFGEQLQWNPDVRSRKSNFRGNRKPFKKKGNT
jgi:superfamily II DNA/RNA helicase